MEQKNDFRVDTAISSRRSFRDVVGKPLLGVSLLLTGLMGIGGLISCVVSTIRGAWGKLGPTAYFRAILPALVYLAVFIILVAMTYSERPFSRTLVCGVLAIACLFILYAFLIPRLPDYVYDNTGLGILVLKDRPLLDGDYLLPGLLFFLLSAILRAGFTMQRELDETL